MHDDLLGAQTDRAGDAGEDREADHADHVEHVVRTSRQAAGEGSTTQAIREPGEAFQWQPFLMPERVGEIDSTNSELARRAAAGAVEGTVVLAERQSAGRGRLGRRWVDQPGGSILCSMLFRPAWRRERWFLAGWVVMLAALAAAAEAAGVELCGKWPNDLLAADGRKVAGVLAEATPEGGLVVGIGLNCNWAAGVSPARAEPDHDPAGDDPAGDDLADLPRRATALNQLAGLPVDRDDITQRMLQHVGEEWRRLDPRESEPAPAAVADLGRRYRDACTTIGQRVLVELAGERLAGTATGIDDLGRLIVETGDVTRTVDSGDVVHLRANAGAAEG